MTPATCGSLAMTTALLRPSLGHVAYQGPSGQAVAMLNTVVCPESAALVQEAGAVGTGHASALQGSR